MATQAPPQRPKLKQAMTATAFNLVQIRLAWRTYFNALGAARRRHRNG